jgi:hypothetical protein
VDVMSSTWVCYQCEKEVNWLAPDGRCGKCTRHTPEEIQGIETSQEDEEYKRHFLFFYTINTGHYTGSGNIWIACDKFPSNKFLKSMVKFDPAHVVINGWTEFSTKEDYDNFISGE